MKQANISAIRLAFLALTNTEKYNTLHSTKRSQQHLVSNQILSSKKQVVFF